MYNRKDRNNAGGTDLAENQRDLIEVFKLREVERGRRQMDEKKRSW